MEIFNIEQNFKTAKSILLSYLEFDYTIWTLVFTVMLLSVFLCSFIHFSNNNQETEKNLRRNRASALKKPTFFTV
jgi:hypothetical protein